jgi:acetyltransferase-like isoleucine patch superfamily enzyme
MSLTISNLGTNNVVSVSGKDEHDLNGTITFRGNGNHLAIGRGTISSNLNISLGSDCRVDIGGTCRLGGLAVFAARKATLLIGRNTSINGYVRMLLHEQAQISVGEGCLLASHVDITVSDMHSIIDVASGKRVNPAQDVVLESRV